MLVNVLFQQDWMHNYHTLLPEMLAGGIRVLIYAGDVDYICNWPASQMPAKKPANKNNPKASQPAKPKKAARNNHPGWATRSGRWPSSGPARTILCYDIL